MNHLADAHSPYLLQHRDNPVDWYPWGEEAFARARAEDRPIFLSVGYATCHWCHVMAHESFEDDDVARLMNETFVSIKVDREERPDVDGLYMTACQLMTGQGGWPLTVLLTPDGRPFYAATYLPRSSRGGRIGMLDLVPRVAELWRARRDDVEAQAGALADALRQAAAPPADEAAPDADTLRLAAEGLRQRYDAAHGGFGDAPKFPTPHTLVFLLRHAHRTGHGEAAAMAAATLRAIRRGGVYDQVGFGLHRYSTDARWLLPHFEKMLYDQALFTLACAEAHAATGDADFAAMARDTIAYVRRDLASPEGAFYAAEDADAAGREGTFYVWTVDELHAVLGPDDGAWAAEVFGAEAAGNFLEEATRRRTGENVLHLPAPIPELAARRGEDEAAFRARLERVRARLFAHREARVRPGLDDKVLTDWNGLMIAALARAGHGLGEPAFVDAAGRAADFVLGALRTPEGRLLHRWRGGHAGIAGHLDDYACLAWGLVELYAATFDAARLAGAVALVDAAVAHFWDEDEGAFYLTADDAEALLVRRKEVQDGAQPSGNAVMLLVLLRLARLTGRADFEERAHELMRALGGTVRSYPPGFTGLLLGVEASAAPAREVVVVGAPGADDTDAMLALLRARYAPHDAVLFRPDAPEAPVDAVAPFAAGYRALDGRATAYVCEHFACEAPTTDLDVLRQHLR